MRTKELLGSIPYCIRRVVFFLVIVQAISCDPRAESEPIVVISIVFGSAANYSFKIQETKAGQNAIYSLDDPNLHPNSVRQQYILGQWYQYTYPHMFNSKNKDLHKGANKVVHLKDASGSPKMSYSKETGKMLLESFASPQPRHSTSAISFIRGLLDG